MCFLQVLPELLSHMLLPGELLLGIIGTHGKLVGVLAGLLALLQQSLCPLRKNRDGDSHPRTRRGTRAPRLGPWLDAPRQSACRQGWAVLEEQQKLYLGALRPCLQQAGLCL